MSQWSREGYHVQHNDALWAAVQIELYRGNGAAAWSTDRVDRGRRSSGHCSCGSSSSGPRCFSSAPRAALAAAVAHRGIQARRSANRSSPLRTVPPAVSTVNGCPARPPTPGSSTAALAAARGDSSRAIPLLTEAVTCFEAVDMHLCAAAARRRLGECLGGTRGQEEIDRADRWMSDQKIKNPMKLASMIVTSWS